MICEDEKIIGEPCKTMSSTMVMIPYLSICSRHCIMLCRNLSVFYNEGNIIFIVFLCV